jgi:hypothetical protein
LPGSVGPTGPNPSTPQAPDQPWWRYDNPEQPAGANFQGPPAGANYQGPPAGANYQGPPAGANYQGPPVYPGPYQAQPGPTLPGPQPPGPPSSRKPLIYGLVAGLVAAVVAAAVLVLSHHPGPTTPLGGPTTSPSVQLSSTPATTQSPTQSPTQGNTISPQEQAAENLSALLTQSVTDRSSIDAATTDAQNCGPMLAQDPQTLENAATNRQNLLTELGNLSGTSNLPPNLIADLTGAWQSSMKADQAYAQYAQDQISNGCVKNDTSDPGYQAAIGPDGHATTYKQDFVAIWNPLATQYGLPTYQWYEL